jgi:hypothetical protein
MSRTSKTPLMADSTVYKINFLKDFVLRRVLWDALLAQGCPEFIHNMQPSRLSEATAPSFKCI